MRVTQGTRRTISLALHYASSPEGVHIRLIKLTFSLRRQDGVNSMPTTPSMTTNSRRAQALDLGSGGLIMTGFGLAWWGIASQAVAYRFQLLYWG